MILARFVIVSIFLSIVPAASFLSYYHASNKLNSESTSIKNLGKMKKRTKAEFEAFQRLVDLHFAAVSRISSSVGSQRAVAANVRERGFRLLTHNLSAQFFYVGERHALRVM